MSTNKCQLFRIWLGVTEYLYRNEALLSEAIEIGITDNSFRSDDLEFTFAARVGLHMLIFGGRHMLTKCRHGRNVYPSAPSKLIVIVSRTFNAILHRASKTPCALATR